MLPRIALQTATRGNAIQSSGNTLQSRSRAKRFYGRDYRADSGLDGLVNSLNRNKSVRPEDVRAYSPRGAGGVRDGGVSNNGRGREFADDADEGERQTASRPISIRAFPDLRQYMQDLAARIDSFDKQRKSKEVVACYDEFERNVITPGLLDRFRFKPGYMFFLQLQKWLVLALPAKSLAVFDLSEYYYPEHNNAARLNYAFQAWVALEQWDEIRERYQDWGSLVEDSASNGRYADQAENLAWSAATKAFLKLGYQEARKVLDDYIVVRPTSQDSGVYVALMDNAPDPEEAQKIFALSRKYEVKSQELTSAVSRLVSKVDAAAEYKQSLDSSKYSRYFNEANYVPNQTQDEAWKEYEESQQAGEKTTVLGFMMISELIEREPLHKDAANRVEKLLHEAITTFELEQDQVTLPNRLLRIQLLRKDREGVEKTLNEVVAIPGCYILPDTYESLLRTFLYDFNDPYMAARLSDELGDMTTNISHNSRRYIFDALSAINYWQDIEKLIRKLKKSEWAVLLLPFAYDALMRSLCRLQMVTAVKELDEEMHWYNVKYISQETHNAAKQVMDLPPSTPIKPVEVINRPSILKPKEQSQKIFVEELDRAPKKKTESSSPAMNQSHGVPSSGIKQTARTQGARTLHTFAVSRQQIRNFSSVVCKWATIESRRGFFEDLGKQLNIKDMSGWYSIRRDEVRDRGGYTILGKYYKGSLPTALMTLFPEHSWNKFKFMKSDWRLKSDRFAYLKDLESQLGITSVDEWYKVTTAQLRDLGAGGYLVHYGHSIPAMLADLYPEHEWLPWRFKQAKRGYWNDIENRRKYVFWVAKQLDIKEISDWYRVSYEDIIGLKGSGFLAFYGDSISVALKDVYPNHIWHGWRFKYTPRGFWQQKENRVAFMHWFAQEMGLSVEGDLEGWYNISIAEIKQGGGGPIVKHHKGSIHDVISEAFPGNDWKKWLFEANQRAQHSTHDSISNTKAGV